MEHSLEEDHKKLKKQIKKWELRLDEISTKFTQSNRGSQYEGIVRQMSDEIEQVTQEMMAVNI